MNNNKALEHENDGDTNRSWCTRNDSQIFVEGVRRVVNRKTSRDQNTEKNPGLEENCFDANSSESPSAKAGEKTSPETLMKMIMIKEY